MRLSCSLLAAVWSTGAIACFNDSGVGSATSATESTGASATTSSAATSATSGSTSSDEPGDGSTSSADGDTTSTTAATTDTSTSTSPSVCGDGVLDPGEECDDGPANADDALCSSECIAASCGDGIVQPGIGEECDDGPDNDQAGSCTEACTAAKCGDGLLWEGEEECDFGPDNKTGGYGDCTPLECTWWGPHCGDGVLQPEHEECDLGEADNEEDGNACSGSCKLDGKVIFVTSKLYNGDLGGLAGGDAECNALALEAGVANAGNFKAWLSGEGHSPASRMTHSEGRYVLLGGETIVADSWNDLTDGTLLGGIDRDEVGEFVAEGDVWTGTHATGLAAPNNCLGWTNASNGQGGLRGSVGVLTAQWSENAVLECGYYTHLLCVEQ